VCGDGLGRQIFDFLKIPHPKKGEYLNIIDGAKIYPPDTRYPIVIKDSKQAGYIIDRLPFGQRLVEDAVKAGAHLYDQTHAISLIKDKNLVSGVTIRSKTIEEKELYANLIIDASGFHTQLRKQVDIPFLTRKIDPNDYIVCYREILHLKNPVVFDRKYISIYMDNIRAPGGYIWYFPRNEY
ncbi:MAG: NAD(P)/FAD-dependent oxidoreductase, partial [Promethearchaeota archaeon]